MRSLKSLALVVLVGGMIYGCALVTLKPDPLDSGDAVVLCGADLGAMFEGVPEGPPNLLPAKYRTPRFIRIPENEELVVDNSAYDEDLGGSYVIENGAYTCFKKNGTVYATLGRKVNRHD